MELEEEEVIESYEEESATLDVDLQKWCEKHSLPFEVVDIDKLESSLSNLKKHTFIFTGNEKNAYNNGYTNHWLFLYGNKIFDSYGLQDSYNLPKSLGFVKNKPARLQAYNSNICGQYCCVFYKFLNENKGISCAGSQFCAEYGFTYNSGKNNSIILQEFEN